jgi:hypothetical protein
VFCRGGGVISVHTGSGAYPPCPKDTRSSYPGVKGPEHKADHSPLSSVNIMNVWSFAFISSCLHGAVGKCRDNLAFYPQYVFIDQTTS